MIPAPFHTEISGSDLQATAQWRDCSDEVRVRVAVWKGGDKGTIVLFPGRTEFIEKYGMVAERFVKMGHSVIAIDWRGQGIADRVHPERQMGHVKDFLDYQLDVKEIMDVAKEEDLPRPFTLLAHSMGGAIGLRALHNGLDVDRVIFSAPMWGIFLKFPMRIFAKAVLEILPRLGMSNRIAPTRDLTNYVETSPFEGNALTNDPEMFEWMRQQMISNPELGIGGPSVHWLQEATHEMDALLKLGAAKQDCLTFYGENEQVVSKIGIKSIMDRWSNGKLVHLDVAQHEVFMERADIQDKVWKEVEAFLT